MLQYLNDNNEKKRGQKQCQISLSYSTGRRNSSITRAYHARRSAILRAIYTQITSALRESKKIHESEWK